MTSSANVTVKRTGEVLVNGTVAGRVEKVESPWMFGSTRTEWMPYDADGISLTSGGFDTRKRAVERVADSVAPLTVSDVKTGTGWPSDDVYVSVRVSVAGTTMFATRYAAEPVWIVDALFLPGTMMPVFSNGEGMRSTRVRALTDDWADAATAAATDAGLWPIA